VATLAQVDHRIIVLSDLADGHPDGEPLGESSAVPVWVALPELRGDQPDCAVLRADRSGARVRAGIGCGPGASAAGREVVVEDASGKPLGRGSVGGGAAATELTVLLPSEDARPATARLTGADAIASDDVAPVVPEAARGGIVVVGDPADETVATGGPPVVEQALSALKLDVDVRPIPAFPDRAEDLTGALGVLLDDPPGLTPEQRHALTAFLERGGVALLALGPHAAAAPLGASLEPVLQSAVKWSTTSSHGADRGSALGDLAESAASLADLGAARRAALAPEDASAVETLVRWSDGAPLVAKRAVGRGEAWVATLPFSAEASDLVLRPAFLALLRAWVHAARERAAPTRTDVGSTWKFPGAYAVTVNGPAGPLATLREDGAIRVAPPLAGEYHLSVDGTSELRVAAPDVRELDLRPRAAAAATSGEQLGHRRAQVDVSGHVALLLLALLAAELALRVWSRQHAEGA
jgi:hypothetical protein